MQAITAASNFLNGKFLDECTLYVTLEPCTMCGGALYWTRISRVVIGAMDFKRGYSSLGIKLHPKTKVSNGILAEESERLLQEFFLKKRNKNSNHKNL